MTSVLVIFRVVTIVTTLLLVGSSVKTAMIYFVHCCCCSVMHNNSIKTYKYKEEVMSRRPPSLGTAALAVVRLASMSLPGRATGQTRQYQSES